MIGRRKEVSLMGLKQMTACRCVEVHSPPPAVRSIVALARKLLLALWRYATLGEIPEGFVLKST
jgi:hypothetical protein